jgi:RND family efflux transporter MFP subunit
MRFFGRSLVGLFMISLTVGLLSFAGSSFYSALEKKWSKEVKKRPARERIFSADVVLAKMTNIVPTINSFGEIRSNRTLELRAPLGGTVVKLAASFEEGGFVTKGQLLLKIDPADAQTAVDVARADLAEAEVSFMDASGSLQLAKDELSLDVAKADLLEAEVQLIDASGYVKLAKEELIAAENQLKLKERAFTRQKDLKRRGVVTDAVVEAAELSVSTSKQAELSRKQAFHKAEIQLEQSGNIVNRRKLNVSDAELSRREAIQKAKLKLEQSSNLVNRRKLNLSNAERLLSETELYAEFNGRLANVSVTSGGLVNNNERLASLIDPSDLEVSFRVSTSQYNYLSDNNGLLIDSPVEVALEVMGDDLVVEGRLTRESASVVEGSSGRLLFAKLSKSTGLRPGDFVSVSVKEPVLKNIFIMPASAIGRNDTILLVNAEDRLEEMTVELLRRQGENVVIRSDDLDGKEFVSKYSQLLGKGIKIKPIRAKVAGDEVFSGPEMIELDEKRRARLIAAVESNAYIPKNVKKKILTALSKKKVRADMVERLEK